MAIATCVFTCKSWFSMSRMTCLIIFSGCSALSIKSFRLARISVETRSSNAINPPSQPFVSRSLFLVRDTRPRLVPVKVQHELHCEQREGCKQQDQRHEQPQRLKACAFDVVVEGLPESADQHKVHQNQNRRDLPRGAAH